MEDVVPVFLIHINGDFPRPPVNISLGIPSARLLEPASPGERSGNLWPHK